MDNVTYSEIIKAAEALAEWLQKQADSSIGTVCDTEIGYWMQDQALNLRSLIALVPKEGMVVVPEEPTKEILDAMRWQIGGTKDNPVHTWGTTEAIYKAMLAAAKETP